MVGPVLAPLLGLLADNRAFAYIKTDPRNQGLEVGQMGTGRGVVVVVRDAGGKLYDDLIFADPLFLLDRPDQVRELAMGRPAAAAAAGHAQGSVRLILGVLGEPAGPFVPSSLALIPRAPLLHDVALQDHNVLFLCEFYLTPLLKSVFIRVNPCL
jgi:hypothetical protein